MRNAHLAAVLVLTAATAAGCSAADEPAADTGSKVSVATPRDALLNAVPDAKVGAYRFDVKGGVTPMSGVLDAPQRTSLIKVSQTEKDAGFTLTMTALAVDKKGWMKIAFTPATVPGLPKLPKSWMAIDPAKIKDAEGAPIGYDDSTDPGYTSLVVQNSAGVKETSPRHYAGTTDLTKSTDAEIVDAATLKALGAKAAAVPFEAAIDGAGHLSSVIVKIPAAGKAKAALYRVTYSGYGSTATPEAPAAGEQTKATAAVYELLNG